jgi:YVTN family beta-propeller protein
MSRHRHPDQSGRQGHPGRTVPAGVAVTHDGAWIYVANELSGNVTVINTRSGAVEATLPSGMSPFSVATSPTDNIAYVADLGPAKLAVIDTGTRQTSSTVTLGSSGTDPFNTAATRHAVYVANQGASTLSVIDPHTLHLVTTVNTGNSPYGVAALPGHDQ